MSITEETRREAYDAVQPKIPGRAETILAILGEENRMTASEIALELYEAGLVPYYSRNFAAPRLTELKAAGKVEVCGRRAGIMSTHSEAVWRAVTQ